MADYYRVTIPVKKHLEKFITEEEGGEIKISNRSFIWQIIRPYLVYKVQSGHRFERVDESFPGKIKILVPQSKVRIYGLQLREQTVGQINQILSTYFGMKLTSHVEKIVKKEGRYKGFNKGVEDFCNKYNIIIDEDISIDALIKQCYRNRN